MGSALGPRDNGHRINALAVDKPIAALLKDLKGRGLLDETIVLWGGEFGRTPCAQGDVESKDVGRDHNPFGFTMWMAGGGFKPGIIYGATDDSATTPSRTKFTSTICTRPSCICSASTISA